MQLTTFISALALTASLASAQRETPDATLARCAAARSTCQSAANANQAFCASQYFSCIAPNSYACGCNVPFNACAQSSTNIFDCAPALANCYYNCPSNQTASSSTTASTTAYSTTLITITSCAPTVTNCPAASGTPVVITSVVPVGPVVVTAIRTGTPAVFTGAANKVGAGAGALLLGAAAMLF